MDAQLEKLFMAEICETVERLADYRRKAHGFYKIAAGDYEKFGWTGQQKDRSQQDNEGDKYLLQVTQFPRGRVNHLRPILRQHILASAIDIPDITIKNMGGGAKTIMSRYCDMRMSNRAHIGCHGAAEMHRWCSDAFISGIGWMNTDFHRTAGGYLRQGITYKGTLDMVWDLTTSSIDRGRWVGWVEPRTAAEWLPIIGQQGLDDLGVKMEKTPYKVVRVLHTFDVLGNEIYWRMDKNGRPNKALRSLPSWCFDEMGGEQSFMLPATPLYTSHQAHVGLPTGIVEDCMPALLDVWDSEDAIRARIRASAPKLFVSKEFFEDTILQQLKNSFIGDDIAVQVFQTKLEAVDMAKGFVQVFGNDLDQGLLRQYEMAIQNLNKAGGANPYAFGAPEAGVDTATEADAINTESSTYQRSTGRRVFSGMARIADMMIRMSRYDDCPLDIDADGVTLRFGGNEPNANRYEHLFDLDFEVTVSEDQDKFKGKRERIAQIEQMFQKQVALNNLPGINEMLRLEALEMGIDEQKLMLAPPPQAPAVEEAQEAQSA